MRLSLAFIVCLLLSVACLAYTHKTLGSEVGFEAIEEVVPQHKKVNKKYKVIIVGGGLSGTNAAYNLINKYKVDPAEVLLIEAKNRVGGRTFSPEKPTYGGGPNTRRDMGAEFVSSLQRRLNAYLDQFKLKRSPILTGHKSTYEAEDGAVSTSLFIPLPLPFLAKIDFGKGIVKLKFLSDTINLSDLSQTPDALIHDKTTVDEWTQTNFKKPQSRAYFNTIMTMAYGSSTSEMSLLHLMLFIKSIGGVSALPKSGEYHIVQGSQQVSEHLALALPEANLKLNTPVLEIIRHEAGAGAEPDEEAKGFVEVMTADHTYVADHVIMAVPVPLTKKITFKPKLSEGRQRLMDASSMGDYVKVQLVCPTRFWTDSWFLFSGVSEIGPLILFTDGSYSTEHEGDKAMLVGFIAGPKADHFMKLAGQAREREILVKRQVTAMFRITQQPSPVAACEYNEFIWKNQAYSDGVTVRFDLGTLSTVGKHLTAPEGNIHFAGSETATEWHGYMEGALASGERAAKEVAIKLFSSSTSGSPIGIEAPAGNKPNWASKLFKQATNAVKARIPLRRAKTI